MSLNGFLKKPPFIGVSEKKVSEKPEHIVSPELGNEESFLLFRCFAVVLFDGYGFQMTVAFLDFPGYLLIPCKSLVKMLTLFNSECCV